MMTPEDIGSSRTAGVRFGKKEDMAAFTMNPKSIYVLLPFLKREDKKIKCKPG